MNSKERIMAAIAGEPTDKVPFLDFINDDVLELISHYYHCKKEDTLGTYKAIGLDAIGCDEYCSPVFAKFVVDGSGIQVPVEGLIKEKGDLDKMEFPDYKAPNFLDPLKRFIEQYGNSGLALYAGMRGMLIYTIIFSMGFEAFSIALMEEPEVIDEMIKRYTEWESEVALRIQLEGIDFIFMYSDMAYNSGPFFSPQVLREKFLPYMRQVADTIQIPWGLHTDGDITSVYTELISLGLNFMHPTDPNSMDIRKIKNQYGKKVTLLGNVDVNLLGMGSTHDIEQYVKMLLKAVASDGRYIFGSGNAITKSAKFENIITMIETFRRYRNYPINC